MSSSKSFSLGKWLAYILLFLLCLVIILVIALRVWQAERVPQGKTTLSFQHVPLDFTNEIDLDNSLPFLASAAFDVDGDGIDELFLGGGDEQKDAFFRYDGTGFTPLNIQLEKEAVDATHGAAHIDVDEDGDVDLFTARESGVWFHENLNGRFSSTKLPLKLGGTGENADNTTPLSIGLGDINQDGLVDLYVAGYIKIDRIEGETNFSNGYGGFSHLFLNTGDLTFKDVTKAWGLGEQHNRFIGTFADMNRDGFSDLVIAQDTGKVETYLNQNGKRFIVQANPSEFSYPMGVAIGDYNNDGWLDAFFSNVGYTLPPFILRGNLAKTDIFNPDHMLFQNQGGTGYVDTSVAANVNRYGFAWGTIFTDINLDSHEDILISQNYARMPADFLMTRYKGKILLGDGGDSFTPVERTTGAVNPHFGIAPIVADFSGDGRPDLVWANVASPSLAYISEADENNWLTIDLPNIAAALNAEISLTLPDGQTRYKQLIAGQGLGSDMTRKVTFGLGTFDAAKQLEIKFQNGTQFTASNIAARQTLSVTVPQPPTLTEIQNQEPPE